MTPSYCDKRPAKKIRPIQHEITSRPRSYHMQRSTASNCRCDFHIHKPHLELCAKLKEKEENILCKVADVKRQMAMMTNYILDYPCDTDDEKLKAIFQIDYKNSGPDGPQYQKLPTHVVANAPNPMKLTKIEFVESYRDPACYFYFPIEKPPIFSCPPVTFNRTPEGQKNYFKQGRGRTEYEDTIDKTARSVLRNMQQYREPLPSSRRRYGDPFI